MLGYIHPGESVIKICTADSILGREQRASASLNVCGLCRCSVSGRHTLCGRDVGAAVMALISSCQHGVAAEIKAKADAELPPGRDRAQLGLREGPYSHTAPFSLVPSLPSAPLPVG